MAYRLTGVGGFGLLPLIYVIVGAFIAGAHHYFSHVHDIAHVISAVLAMLLWPLILVGIGIHVH
jgi:hypothetical protein